MQSPMRNTDHQDAAGRDEDPAADDGADDDGDSVEESHLGLQLHLLLPLLPTRSLKQDSKLISNGLKFSSLSLDDIFCKPGLCNINSNQEC